MPALQWRRQQRRSDNYRITDKASVMRADVT